MKVTKAELAGVLIFEPDVRGDGRGFFMEMYQADRYRASGLERHFVQDNLSRSSRGVLRGLHLQNQNPQGKLVTVLRGSVLDVALDARVGSPTFGKHVAVELTENNRLQLWVPRGFAHGFLVTSDSADLFYKCDAPYSPSDEVVIRWNDPDLHIEWGTVSPHLSERDQRGRTLVELAPSLRA